ncbi:MAG: sulfotransferase domain-containing protein [Gammaproteobacteria bacterium]
MLILSLGVPRSGTIFVFNVLREALTRRRIEFSSVNANYPETTAYLSRYDFSGNVLMHAHNVLPEVQRVLPRENVRAFFNFRDPRDVLVSMMRLHDYSFEKCLELVDISFAQFTTARKFPGVMFIPYTHVMASPDAVIFQVAQKAGVFLSLDEVVQIRKATSIESHTKIMKAVGAGKVDVQIRRNPKRTMKESSVHFINDRHIQSGRSGRWRRELSAEQQEAVTRHYKPLLVELGFERE